MINSQQKKSKKTAKDKMCGVVDNVIDSLDNVIGKIINKVLRVNHTVIGVSALTY